jgi:glutamine transport system permease protein
MFDNFFEIAVRFLPRLLRGVGETIELTLLGVTIGLLIGLVVGVIRANRVRVLNLLALGYINVIRGTPLLVQIFFIFFGLPTVLGRPIDPLVAGVSAIAINSGAYFAEIVRGAVQSIHRGQIEAARSLGLNWFKTLRYVIGPQALLLALPPLGNQYIISLKDTSLLAVIGVEELTRNGQIIIAATFRAFQIWLIVAILYLILTSVAAVLLSILESRMSRYLYT